MGKIFKRAPYTDWMIRLEYAFKALGYSHTNIRLDWNAFKAFYEMGYTPIETALIDLEEGGES